jgi:hypothetical protein
MKAIAVMVNIETEDVNSFHISGDQAKMLAKLAIHRARKSGKAPVDTWQWHVFADEAAQEQFDEFMWQTAKMIETLAGESLPDDINREEVIWAMEETIDEAIDEDALDSLLGPGGITFPIRSMGDTASIDEAKVLLDNLTEEELLTRLTAVLDDIFEDDKGEQQ